MTLATAEAALMAVERVVGRDRERYQQRVTAQKGGGT